MTSMRRQKAMPTDPMELARDIRDGHEKYNRTAPGYRKRSTKMKKLRRRARKVIADRK